MTPKADTRHRREAERGSHDFDLACEILDAGNVCHVGFTMDGQPYVIPMAYGRHGDQLLIHGSVASRAMKSCGSNATPIVLPELAFSRDRIPLSR